MASGDVLTRGDAALAKYPCVVFCCEPESDSSPQLHRDLLHIVFPSVHLY